MTETPTSDAHRGAAVPAESILEAVEDAFGHAQPRTSSSAGGLRQAVRHDRPAGSPDLARAPVSRAESWGAGAAGGLGSLSVQERRGLLEAILATGIASEQVEPVTRVLLNDPDPELRRLAARALAGAEPAPRSEVVRRGLLDPDDSVRAAVVALAARAGIAAISTIVPLVADRTWPVAQHAAVEELAGFVREAGPLAEPDHDRLLAAVAALDPPPLSSEREALKDLARAIGVDRLATDLRRSGGSQLGAARLLTAEGSTAALQAVTARRDDGPEEIHALAQRAAAELDTRPDAGRPVAPSLPATRETETAGELGSDEILSILGVALDDPSEAVRDQARAALRMLGRGDVIAAVERSLRTGDDERAATTAGVAGALGLIECGPALLGRAASFAEVERGPFLRALAALGIGPEDLSSLLSAQDAAHRPRAVRMVWEIAGRAVLPFLVGLLEDSMGAVRMAVLEVFAESGDPSAATLAFELLQRDSSAAVRAAAVHALARSGGEVRLRGLAMALADADPDVRATAVETLPAGVMVPGRLPEETPQPSAQALARALDDPDERVARAAASRLAGIAGREGPAVWAAIRDRPAAREQVVRQIEQRDPGRLAALAVANADAPQASDRILAVELAVRAATQEATSVVVTALGDPDPTVRRIAASAMSSLRSPAAVDALSRSLSDPRADIRVEAVRALGLIDDDSVPSRLITALKDPEVRVRESAVEALVRWRSPAVAGRLAEALSSPDLRRSAGEVVVRMGGVAVEPLIDLVMRSDANVRGTAGALLERIEGTSRFVGDLGSTNPDTRLRAVEVLGAMGGRVAAEALLQALNDPEVGVRSRAATLLGALGDLRAVPALKRMFLSDPVVEVAVAAEAALTALGSPPDTEGVHEEPGTRRDA